MTIPASAVTVTDDTGTTVAADATPVKIISLAPSNTEILASLDLLNNTVGITDACDYPPEVKKIPRVGGDAFISIERVAAAQPDLILASDITPKATVQRLRDLGLTVIVLAPRNLSQVIEAIRLVGSVTGSENRAQAIAESMAAHINNNSSDTPSINRPTIAHILWHEPIMVSGNNTLQNDVIVHAGGSNAFGDQAGWYTTSLETLLAKNPDIIIVNDIGNDQTTSLINVLLTSPKFSSLSAVKRHHVYAVDPDIISRPGPRIVEGLEQVREVINNFKETAPLSSSVQSPKTPPQCSEIPGFVFLIGFVYYGFWSLRRMH